MPELYKPQNRIFVAVCAAYVFKRIIAYVAGGVNSFYEQQILKIERRAEISPCVEPEKQFKMFNSANSNMTLLTFPQYGV